MCRQVSSPYVNILLFFFQHQEATSRAAEAGEEATAVDHTVAASDSGRGSTTDQLQTDSMQTDSFELAQETLPQENVSTYGCFNKIKVSKTGFRTLLYNKKAEFICKWLFFGLNSTLQVLLHPHYCA